MFVITQLRTFTAITKLPALQSRGQLFQLNVLWKKSLVDTTWCHIGVVIQSVWDYFSFNFALNFHGDALTQNYVNTEVICRVHTLPSLQHTTFKSSFWNTNTVICLILSRLANYHHITAVTTTECPLRISSAHVRNDITDSNLFYHALPIIGRLRTLTAINNFPPSNYEVNCFS